MTPVKEFHQRFGLTVNDVPTVPSDADIRLRIRLIKEETDEVVAELRKLLVTNRNLDQHIPVLQNVLAELADLRYVLEGTAVTLGLPIDEAFAEVHRANMTKIWPDGSIKRDAGGKVIKPPTYQKADMGLLIETPHDVSYEED